MVSRRVSCVGRRRPGGVSRENRGSNVFALVRVRVIHRLRRTRKTVDGKKKHLLPLSRETT